jgi:hypothetical protein
LTFYNNFGSILVLREKNNPIKKERKMKRNIIALLATLLASISYADVDEVHSYFNNDQYDFKDTDGDGMTDYGELKYGYDPFSAESNPLMSGQFIGNLLPDNSDFVFPQQNSEPQILFTFSDTGFSNLDKTPFKNFLLKVIPLIQYEMGLPFENRLCSIKRRITTDGYGSSLGGRVIGLGKNWRPSSFVHELVHTWHGTAKLHGNGLSLAWEEGMATALQSVICNEYLKCYPVDNDSKLLLSKRGRLGHSTYLYGGVESLFDQSKFQKNLGGWSIGENTWEYYTHSASFFKILRMTDNNFMKNFHKQFYQKVRQGKKSYWSTLNIIHSLAPQINGTDSTEFIKSMKMFQKNSKLDNGFIQLLMRRGYVDYVPKVSPAFVKGGAIEWYTYDKSFQEIPTYTLPNGKIIPDFRNQPFQVNLFDSDDVKVKTLLGTTKNKSNDDGSPATDISVSVSDLSPSKHEQGIYKTEITFTNFTHSTDYNNSIYYIFGKQDLIDQINKNYTIMIGFDSHSLVNQYLQNCKIVIDGTEYVANFKNNCAFFVLKNLPNDYEGMFEIKVQGPNVPQNFSGSPDNSVTQIYKRTLVSGGSADAKRHHCFLLIDEDYDGIEDEFDSDILDLQNEWNLLLHELESTEPLFDPNTDVNIDVNEATQTHNATNQESQTNTYSESDKSSILQIETESSVVIVSGVNDAYYDNSSNVVIDTDTNTIIVEDTLNITAFDGTYQPSEDDNVIIAESGQIALYANDSTSSEITTENSIVTITQSEIIVDANESDRNKRLLAERDAPEPPPSVVSAWESCEQIETNWFYVDWFGYFYKMPNNNWIYHEKFGWMYVDFTTTFESVWIYHEILGWMWTSENTFSYTYNPYTDSWIYLVDIGYYDFNLDKWIAF